MSTVIAVVNKSKDITDTQARLMTKACHRQIKQHVAPLWNAVPWDVRFYTKETSVPQHALAIVILPNEAGAEDLGYHYETPSGRRYGRVFTRPILQGGGAIYETGYSISAILSHEVIEAFVDPDINLWAEGKPGVMWSYEACDPVQEDAYKIKVDDTYVFVSNFVLPAWFDLHNPEGTRYDYLKRLTGPFKMTTGGYATYWDGGAKEKTVYGRRSARKKAGKNHVAARSVRRTGGRVKF